MVKIKCPDGSEKTVAEVLDSDYLPKPILKALLEGRDKKRVRKPNAKSRFGVTRLVGDCLRKSYYDLVEDIPISLEQLWIFSRGHAIHNFIQAHLSKEEQEIFLSKSFGEFDAIGFIDAMHDNVLFEYKTTQNIPPKPKQSHLLQAQAYYSMLSPKLQEKIKKLQIIYFSLNKIKIFDVPKQNLLPYLEARGTILAQALKMANPPNKEEGSLCNYCEFAKICKPSNLYPAENNKTKPKPSAQSSLY